MNEFPENKPRLLDMARDRIRLKHYSDGYHQDINGFAKLAIIQEIQLVLPAWIKLCMSFN
jgi:hypothetical protein